MKKSLTIFSFVFALMFSKLGFSQEQPVAIVVHPSVSVTDLSMDQLRRLFLANQQFWPDNSRVTLLLAPYSAVYSELFLDRIYQMSESQLDRYWIRKVFRAEVPSEPRVVMSSSLALGLVNAIPGSITFMPASEVDSSIKVLSIDGFLPDQPGYPLR